MRWPRLDALQEAAERTLSDEELRRNGQRIDAFFVSSAHPIAPDIYELGDLANAVQSAEERRKIERAMDPQLTGAPSATCAALLSSLPVS